MSEAIKIVEELRAKFSKMKLREWENSLADLVEHFRMHDLLVEIHDEADAGTQIDARIRVVCKRAFRARYGVSISNREIAQHHLFGRF